MFSSRTLAERNSDPAPWSCRTCDGCRNSRENKRDGHVIDFAPRDKYQYGKLPANPILLAFRRDVEQIGFRSSWDLWFWSSQSWPGNPSEKAHFSHVLNLLASLHRSDS